MTDLQMLQMIEEHIAIQERMYDREKTLAREALDQGDVEQFDFHCKAKMDWAQRKDALEYLLQDIQMHIDNELNNMEGK